MPVARFMFVLGNCPDAAATFYFLLHFAKRPRFCNIHPPFNKQLWDNFKYQYSAFWNRTKKLSQSFAKKPLLLLEDSKHTILVAEDNPIYQKVVANQLSKLGYPCKVVENGRLALEELQSHPKEYSLVLLDLEMPVMNGFECADAIRHANDGVNNIPIVAFSTTKDDDFRKRTVDIGFSEFLQKPATSADLDTTLKRWLTPVS